MKSIKRRIAFHFSLQFIFMVLLVTTVLLAAIFYLLKFQANKEVSHSFPDGFLEAIATETMVEEPHTEVRGYWIDTIKERKMWLQIINENGKVIHKINVPAQIPDQYSINQIMEIEANQKYGSYAIATYVDSFLYDHPYYFILGYQDEIQKQLIKWFNQYNQNGLIQEDNTTKLTEQLQQEGYFLDIIDNNGKVLKRLGQSTQPLQYSELLITAQLKEPYNYDDYIHVKQAGDYTWVLHTPFENEPLKFTLLQEILILLSVIGGVILFTLILLSVWHAIRYGQPLLLFISWLDRMRNGEYDKVFTEKEKKQLFNKKNKVKRRYRLYKEVIQEFYDMAEQLASLEKERALLEQRREEWMAGISHDLRTPLSTIQGYGHLLESSHYKWNEAELMEIGETIRKKSDYMLDLIQDFSLISQLKQKELPIEFSTIDLRDVIKNCTDKYSEYNSIHMQIPNFPIPIKGNAQWMERLLDNLIINAVKHNPEDTQVTVKAAIGEMSIILTVEDDGIGMDELTKKNLFTRYYRGTRSEEWTDGSGLGMSIANAIAQAHQGVIQVESMPNLGTSIQLTLPMNLEID